MATPGEDLEKVDVTTLSKTKELKGAQKRDSLTEFERRYQEKWHQDGVFQVDAPSTSEIPLHSLSPAEIRSRHQKFFGTMAYPYMNGTLHAGHGFSVSKVEFASGFARMEGKRSLFPMGFHCTGMPIKVCADKLVNEMQIFGKYFEHYKDVNDQLKQSKDADIPGTAHEDVTKFTAKKGKAAVKLVNLKYQFKIMLAIGIPIEEIHLFADPQHWLKHFPPLCQRDLTNLGCRIDWRRSMITTDSNPYYDAFVRWQMNRLRELKKIKFGKRYTIYSTKDKQPCMDHDRSEGETVGPQEYTALKLKVLEWAPEAENLIKTIHIKEADIYFVAATLRAETMYGQTCCFVNPKINYGIFKVSAKEYFIITSRSAWNMAHQGIFTENGKMDKVGTISGSTCVGTLVNAPLSLHAAGVRILPMESVSESKGTGIVTSVPSDSPDDYATVIDLAKKSEYYGIQKEWAQLEILPIIQTPSYGDLTAPFLVKKLKIMSPKDTKLLQEAKELAYKEGFYQGILLQGEFKGEKVEVAKSKVKQKLLESGEGFSYYEPERQVISRSGDECCVALMDQWYIDYGEESWKQTALKYVQNKDGTGLRTYAQETKNGFEGVLNWLNQWACARSFGLGSKLPWDPQFLVESLSDSTIYMAYYTISHYLHGDIFGKTPGLANIKPEQMTDEVFDYIFARRDLNPSIISESNISEEILASMRREFEYWYPLDLRASGKDLIPNHLTFFLYVHLAIFSPEFWPKGVRANGHLLLNGEKMAKSSGNFMTLNEMVRKYGADASRIALADAGDGVADANFDEYVADNSVLRLFTLREWIKEQVNDAASLRTGPKNNFLDKLFENEMNVLVNETRQSYKDTNYKLALKSALYEFTSARDFYREYSAAAGIKMHHDLIFRYIELQALIICVIAPHWAEYIWLEVLQKESSIQNALFPTVPAPNPALSAEREYVRATSGKVTSTEAAQQKKKAKGKEIGYDISKPKKLTIYFAQCWPEWQSKYIDLLKTLWDRETNSMKVDDRDLNSRVASMGELKANKRVMSFVQGLKKRLLNGEDESTVFERTLQFDEGKTLENMVPGLKKAAGLAVVDVIRVMEGGKSGEIVGTGQKLQDLPTVAEIAVPGVPTFALENVAA
ncbi:BgTH12-02606 [Blumeria graminis f. sp. triticale]|uniref:leucine--tRNA ligase n=3 Tax=Blumeria graminis TaxID=34373 RepID=A0A381LES1_BLUGR|nr:Cytosolic leucyl tRNA synthetase [Blumeria graminis f. sp. tritici 96224]CAD6502932.1 BgTH12-02606 [Blumeria graminis f. sp. triticale]VDB88789.1 Bgt-947 [Blumeria graminis f. sp. tritici]